VIGDRALRQRSVSAFHYDLGEAWKKMTGLPFVFAAWISNKSLDAGWVHRFDEANAWGVKNADVVAAGMDDSLFDLHEYYTRYLSYEFDAEKKKGLDLFLNFLADQQQVSFSENIAAK
jgi:chorismate dehydratase